LSVPVRDIFSSRAIDVYHVVDEWLTRRKASEERTGSVPKASSTAELELGCFKVVSNLFLRELALSMYESRMENFGVMML